MGNERYADCARCTVKLSERICVTSEGRGPDNCPTLRKKELVDDARKEYHGESLREFARQASIQEGSCYADRDAVPFVLRPVKTRIQEICEFAQRMKYRRLGLVFCSGLIREAATVARILEEQGFEVVSVVCNVGRIDKNDIGVADNEKIMIGQPEAMCNPVMQAKVVNDAKTELNIALGLCVGHDAIFFQHAQAPTTVLAAKDRVTLHNPLVPIYAEKSYYRKVHNPGF